MHDSTREERFRSVYQAHYALLIGYALRRVPEPEDAADIVAETLLVAWRRLDDLPVGDQGRLWLYGVARRVLANQRRGERRRSALRELIAQEVADVIQDAPVAEDLGPLRDAWWALRADDRDLLGLVAWEGLSHAQVGRVVGCSAPVAKLRVHRARRRFAGALEAAGCAWKPQKTTGHVRGGRAPACPGTEELS